MCFGWEFSMHLHLGTAALEMLDGKRRLEEKRN